MKKVSSYQLFEDERGKINGIINSGCWREINLIESKKGAVRGGHYHKTTEELFYILGGEIKVVIVDMHGKVICEFTAHQGDIFIIEPYEAHTFTALSDCTWLNALSEAMAPEAKDRDIHSL